MAASSDPGVPAQLRGRVAAAAVYSMQAEALAYRLHSPARDLTEPLQQTTVSQSRSGRVCTHPDSPQRSRIASRPVNGKQSSSPLKAGKKIATLRDNRNNKDQDTETREKQRKLFSQSPSQAKSLSQTLTGGYIL